MSVFLSFLLSCVFLSATAKANFIVVADSITIKDAGTGYADVHTMFNGEPFVINLNLIWKPLGVENPDADPSTVYALKWASFVDDVQVDTGVQSVDLSIETAESIEAGTATVNKRGSHSVRVTLEIEGQDLTEATRSYQSFNSGASFVPLLLILLLAITTHEVYFSLGVGIFVGACMVTGTITDGFKTTLDTYILGALNNVDHGYVYLFTLFMSGFVGIMQKSGGIIGFTRWISRFATTPRAGQLAAFFTGLLIFFDDYANILIAGPCMKPMFDSLMLSAEKLSFIVDATSAPVASLFPVSSWIGFEVSLIQAELDKLVSIYPDGLTVLNTGFGVFLQTIAYRYYPIFMIFLMAMLIIPQRDFGPMLIAERRCLVYGRTDGGDGSTTSRGLKHKQVGMDEEVVEMKPKNSPEPDTPVHPINFLVPVGFLVFYVFYFLVITGNDGTGNQTFLDIMQQSDSYSALLWGTMASALTALGMYFLQFKKEGKHVLPTLGSFVPKSKFTKRIADENAPKILMDWREGLEAFMTGMEHVFLALVLLTEAWAFGAVTTAVGLDRFFSNLIVQGSFSAEWLPTISFVVSLFIALATGSSWSTMTIMFPLLLVPTYIKSGGNASIFYATTAGVLSGSVAGDHASPVSDTTVLSSMYTSCQLLAHVRTQAPIVFVVVIWSVLVGTIPIGLGSYSNGIAILMGFILCAITSLILGVPVLSANGRYDLLTELFIYFSKESELHKLKKDTIRAFETGGPVKEDCIVHEVDANGNNKPDEHEPNDEEQAVVAKVAESTIDDTIADPI